MPKKATSSSRIPKVQDDGTKAGYFMYADGKSAWGCGLFRGMEMPLRIDAKNAQEIHTSKVEDKVTWYQDKQKEIAEALKTAKAKAKK